MEGLEQKKEISASLERATEADIDALIEIEKSIGGVRTYSPMLEEEEWKQELQGNSVFLLKNGEDIVGSISYEEKSPNHLYISGIVVRPEFQGKGIAKAALQRVLDEHQDAKRIDLVTHPENPALQLYESLGFKVESRHENYWGEGEPRLVLVMER
ncbi:MAG: GNAT family N-acetyltransferase [Patescibacteria group bacterium]